MNVRIRPTANLRLRDPEYLDAFLRARLKEGSGEFFVGLREAVKAQEGGLAGFARRIGIARVGLYKALTETGNPSFTTVYRILEGLGVDREILIGTARSVKRPLREKPATTKVNEVKRKSTRKRIEPGSARGQNYYMSPDFNAPLEDFDAYM
jgi:probable addiction module antidote protein